MKTSYLYLGSILFSVVGYIFFIIKNKGNANKLKIKQGNEYLNSTKEPLSKSRSSTGNISPFMQFKFIAQPDYSTWKKVLFGLLGFSILLPWIMNEMSIVDKIIGSFFMVASMSVLFLSIFAAMNCKKIEIKEGKINVNGFFYGNYSLCSSDIIEIKYRLRNQIFELRERRNDDLNNEYKIKMMSFKSKDVQKVLHYCHLIETANQISMVQAYF